MNIDAPVSRLYPGLKSLWQQAFGDTDGFIEGFFQKGFSPERCRCITEEGAVVAALYWFDCSLNEETWAYIYAVATDSAHRGKGLCAALMTQTHQDLRAAGYAGAVLVPAEEHLWRYYGKFGYLPFGSIDTVKVPAGDIPAAAQEITEEDYRALRKRYLPADSVDQRSAYPFYSTWGKFYRGDDCCFAAAMDEDTLYFQEFLGSAASIPGLLKTLGAKVGNARLISGKASCGMYLPFGSSAPGYLGFPLD